MTEIYILAKKYLLLIKKMWNENHNYNLVQVFFLNLNYFSIMIKRNLIEDALLTIIYAIV